MPFISFLWILSFLLFLSPNAHSNIFRIIPYFYLFIILAQMKFKVNILHCWYLNYFIKATKINSRFYNPIDFSCFYHVLIAKNVIGVLKRNTRKIHLPYSRKNQPVRIRLFHRILFPASQTYQDESYSHQVQSLFSLLLS